MGFLTPFFDFLKTDAARWLCGPIVAMLCTSTLFLIKKLIFRKIYRVTQKTKLKLDDILVASLKRPLSLIILATGVVILETILPLSPEWDKAIIPFFKLTVIVSFIFFLDHFLRGLTETYGATVDFVATSKGIIKGLIRGILIGIGVMIILDAIGVSITPLLASLGIGSLAVALALQDTLSNFFSGIYTMVDKPVRVGDFIKLETGEEGYVTDVGWRNTRIRMLPNNTVIIPNSKLVGSVITNYYLPEPAMAVLVQVGVHYDSDLKHVERVTCEVAKKIMQTIPGGVPEFEPFIRYHTFSDSSINFTVIMRAKKFVDNYLVKHEFIKALHARYKEEGIVIPYPLRTLDIPMETIEALKQPVKAV
ncbi:MAG TPA: mechanosensitive ion channel family protein [Anaerolineae bacterium]|nr:mechanosensitive ion channel family protein [Anaerolineae bacterium]